MKHSIFYQPRVGGFFLLLSFADIRTALPKALLGVIAYAIWIHSAEMYFKSGFEPNTVLENYKVITGVDKSTGYDWGKIGATVPIITALNFRHYSCQVPGMAYSDIVNDPDGTHGKVLHAKVGTGQPCRTSGHVYLTKSCDQICLRYKMKFSKDYQEVLNGKVKFVFFQISEVWTDGPDSRRASVGLHVKKGKGGFGFFAYLRAFYDGRYHTLWRVESEKIVPLDKWVEVVQLIKRGPKGKARFYWSVDGEVFIDTNNPIEWGGQNWRSWAFFKVYHNSEVGRGLRSMGKASEVWYDDLEIWNGLPDKPTAIKINVGLPNSQAAMNLKSRQKLIISTQHQQQYYHIAGGNVKSVSIVNSSGRIIKVIHARSNGITWDGTDSHAKRVKPGAYYARLVSEQGIDFMQFVIPQ